MANDPKPPVQASRQTAPAADPVSHVQAPKPPKAPEAVKPAEALSRFRVTLGADSEEIAARDANEAWAKFCDARKAWPGPKASGRKVEAL